MSSCLLVVLVSAHQLKMFHIICMNIWGPQYTSNDNNNCWPLLTLVLATTLALSCLMLIEITIFACQLSDRCYDFLNRTTKTDTEKATFPPNWWVIAWGDDDFMSLFGASIYWLAIEATLQVSKNESINFAVIRGVIQKRSKYRHYIWLLWT